MMERDGSSNQQWAGSLQGIREGWERTAAGWAEADGSHTRRQGGDVERVWALERQTSWNPGSVALAVAGLCLRKNNTHLREATQEACPARGDSGPQEVSHKHQFLIPLLGPLPGTLDLKPRKGQGG